MMKLSILLLGFALVACTPKSVIAPEGGGVAKRVAMAECGATSGEDCRLQGEGIAFEVRYGTEAPDVLTAKIDVVLPGDATLQTIEEEMSGVMAPPSLQDLDGDGRAELLVPLYTGNVNTNYAVWHQAVATEPFVRAGELSGVDFGLAENGFIFASGRSSAASWQIDYFRMNGSTLNAVASVTVTAEEADSAGNVISSKCEATDAGAMTSLGMTPEDLDQTFCGDAVAKSIFAP